MNKKTNEIGYRSNETGKFEKVPLSKHQEKEHKKKLKINDLFEE